MTILEKTTKEAQLARLSHRLRQVPVGSFVTYEDLARETELDRRRSEWSLLLMSAKDALFEEGVFLLRCSDRIERVTADEYAIREPDRRRRRIVSTARRGIAKNQHVFEHATTEEARQRLILETARNAGIVSYAFGKPKKTPKITAMDPKKVLTKIKGYGD